MLHGRYPTCGMLLSQLHMRHSQSARVEPYWAKGLRVENRAAAAVAVVVAATASHDCGACVQNAPALPFPMPRAPGTLQLALAPLSAEPKPQGPVPNPPHSDDCAGSMAPILCVVELGGTTMCASRAAAPLPPAQLGMRPRCCRPCAGYPHDSSAPKSRLACTGFDRG